MAQDEVPKLRYEEMVRTLLLRVPSFAEIVGPDEDAGFDYVIFGAFARFLNDRVARYGLRDAVVGQGFALLNEMASSDDRRIVSLAAAGAFEVLLDSPHGSRAAHELLRGAARNELDDVKRTLGPGRSDPV